MVNQITMNNNLQFYRGIPLRIIDRKFYGNYNAKRFVINGTNQNVWIPNRHLTDNGTIKDGEDIDYVFRKAVNQLNKAGITWAIPRIKRAYNGK